MNKRANFTSFVDIREGFMHVYGVADPRAQIVDKKLLFRNHTDRHLESLVIVVQRYRSAKYRLLGLPPEPHIRHKRVLLRHKWGRRWHFRKLGDLLPQ